MTSEATKKAPAKPANPKKAETKDTPEVEEPKQWKLKTRYCELSEHARTYYRIVVPHGTPMAAIHNPSFWSHVAKRMSAGVRLEIITEDMTEFAEAIVIDSNSSGLRIAVVNQRKLESQSDELTHADFDLAFSGPVDKWRVTRRTDGNVMSRGHQTKDAANLWLTTYMRG